MKLRGSLARPRFPLTRLGKIFAGQSGVRTGWRLGLFLLILLVPLVLEVFGFFALARHAPALVRPPYHPSLMLLNEVMFLGPVCLATAIMAWLEGRAFMRFGLRDRAWARRLASGLPLGIGCLVLLLGALRLLDAAYFGQGGLSLLGDLGYGAEWLAVSILVGITEEFMYRGYFLATLGGGIGFWPAAIVSSVLFALTHASNHGEAIIGLLQIFTIAMFFCFSLRRTGSLWCAIGVHAGWDYAQNFLFGTPDSGVRCYATLLSTVLHGSKWLSGGVVGPEGSPLSLAVPVLLALAIAWIYPPNIRADAGPAYR